LARRVDRQAANLHILTDVATSQRWKPPRDLQAVGINQANRCGPGRSDPKVGEHGLSTASLLWGLLFGSIGLGFFVYGKRQRAAVPMLCGVALMIFPYFVSGIILTIVIGTVLIAIPYFLRL
jgi:hypothetical protein